MRGASQGFRGEDRIRVTRIKIKDASKGQN